MAYRHAERKKKGCFSRLLMVLLCLIIAVTALHLCTGCLGDAEKFFMKAFYPMEYSEYVEQSSEKYGLDKALVYAVIKTESGFDPNA